MCLIVCDKKGRIIFAGKLFLGHDVDINMFKKELSNFDYANLRLWVDLGFKGIEKTLKNTKTENKDVIIGHKK